MENKFYQSNGTEGMIFEATFCKSCYKYNQCTILTNSLIGKQPKQWIYDNNNKPFCTSFNPSRPKAKKKVKQLNEPSLFNCL